MFTGHNLKKYKKKVIKDFEKEFQRCNFQIETISETSNIIKLKIVLDGAVHIQNEKGQVSFYPERFENGIVLSPHTISSLDGFFTNFVFKLGFDFVPQYKYLIDHPKYDVNLITGFKISKHERNIIGVENYLSKKKIRERNKKLNHIFEKYVHK